ncbi:MAG: YwaF family protein [Metamycoplasmataceae bacterium]
MISNLQFLGKELPPVTPTGFFGLSFLSWQGNQMSYADSQWMVYLIYAFVIISCFLIFVFKDNLRTRYQASSTGVINGTRVFGFFILLLSIFRVVILGIGGYPNLWELIPLHFCRIFVFLIGLALILKKIEFVKYFSFFAIGGGMMGLAIPDLSNSQYWSEFGGMEIGLDNYVFWDFFIIHASSIILPAYLLACLKPIFYKSEITYTMIIMGITTIIVFGLNFALANVEDPRWRANWFYLGVPEINGIDDMLAPFLGPLVSYPAILFTFTGIGIILYLGFAFAYINSDRLHFIMEEYHKYRFIVKIKIIPSENMQHFIDGPFKYRKKYNLE